VFEARAGEKGGEVRRFGTATSDYQTDALTHEYALPLIAERARDRDPLFLWLSYHPPHKGVGRDDAASRRCSVGDPASKPPEFAIPAPRHADRFADARIPRVPSVNEADVSDKPERIRARRRLDRDELALLDRGYGCSLASLAAVDDAIGEVVAALRDAGELERTVLAFTSDQGILAGEHRYETKNVPYEEALRVPLFIRGPGIEPGRKLADPTMNADLAPTILDLAGVRMAPELRRPVDGISLAPLLRGEERLRDRAIPIEGRYDPQEGEDGVTVESYVGVRTSRYTYVERHLAPVDSKEAGRETPIGAGEVIATELYDNHRDPYQLESRHDDAAYAATRKELAGLVEHLRGCAGRACFVRAGAPPPDGD
jgi:N-acetylglucosamine-6-sulfatase